MSDFHPISALQHLLYCERQCALIHLDREWSENRFTAEGQVLHQQAHSGKAESRSATRITRSLTVASHQLKLIGKCDIVEFHHDGTVLPVEYKRGRPKQHRADEVQLCAQALALEEMLSIEIATGHLYYGEKRRRTIVSLDESLRSLTIETALRLQALFAQSQLPPAHYHPNLCNACSLIDICQPQADRSAARWFKKRLGEIDS